MTFREKLQIEHPDHLFNKIPEGCPHLYGYEGFVNRPCNGINPSAEMCRDCWNREMPTTGLENVKEAFSKIGNAIREATEDVRKEDYFNVGYNNGLADAWELAKKCVHLDGCGEDNELMYKIFNTVFIKQLFDDNTPQEALAKLKAHEDSKIEVGDIIELENGHSMCVTITDQGHMCGIDEIGRVYIDCDIKEHKKTGKHIDIQSILEQIGE